MEIVSKDSDLEMSYRFTIYVQTPTPAISALAAQLLPRTDLVSSSLSINPRFLMAPAFGALSLGCAASAFRYAVCNARTLVAWMSNSS